MAGDDFTRTLFQWLGQVACDARLPGNATRLAVVIGHHINREKGYAFPGQERLATFLGMTPRAVRRLAEALREAGHMQIEEAHGRNQSNHYRIVLKTNKKRTDASGFNDKEDNSVRSKPDKSVQSNTGQTGPLSTERNRTILAVKPDNPVQETGPDCPTNHLNEPIEEPSDSLLVEKSLFGDDVKASKTANGKRAQKELDKASERWWKIYPKKTGKIGAQKLFVKTVTDKLATIEELIAGAEQCARDYAGERRRYAKDPQKWLRNGHWHDEPDVAQPHVNGARPSNAGFGKVLTGLGLTTDADQPEHHHGDDK